jgi:hypothetical protein
MTVRAAQDGAESTTSALERAALDWIRPYSQRHHLMRTRDWALELDPGAREALRLAALTHDIERHFPGGLVQDKTGPWDDPAYNRAHAERSARIVGEWLVEQGAERELVAPVEELIRMHETGGSPEADLLQAADSLSFLETLQDIACSWVRDGVCDAQHAKAKHRWMLERIRVPRACELAQPLFAEAIAAIDDLAAGLTSSTPKPYTDA